MSGKCENKKISEIGQWYLMNYDFIYNYYLNLKKRLINDAKVSEIKQSK